MNYQDIHLEDKALWNQLQTAWEQDDYTTALNVLKNASLTDRQLNAAVINASTIELLRLQSQGDTDFKQDKIVVSVEPPPDLVDGGVYFKLLGTSSDYGATAQEVEMLQKSNTNYVQLMPETNSNNVVTTIGSPLKKSSLDDVLEILAGFFI